MRPVQYLYEWPVPVIRTYLWGPRCEATWVWLQVCTHWSSPTQLCHQTHYHSLNIVHSRPPHSFLVPSQPQLWSRQADRTLYDTWGEFWRMYSFISRMEGRPLALNVQLRYSWLAIPWSSLANTTHTSPPTHTHRHTCPATLASGQAN